MIVQTVIQQAQDFMRSMDLAGWLLYDYRGINPIFWDIVGSVPHVTRPCWLWIPVHGKPQLLVSFVDQGRFSHLGIEPTLFVNRQDMSYKLMQLFGGCGRIAMEYSPDCALPRVSKVDAGTLEIVRGLGAEVVSSADLLQYATQRWDRTQLQSHMFAAEKLTQIVHEAFKFIGESLSSEPTEHDVAQFIRDRFYAEGLLVTDGPTVAANEHASDPHFDPTPDNAVAIKQGDWVLIDLWTRLPDEDAMYGDITWTAYVGETVPARNSKVFRAVVEARDAALTELDAAFRDQRQLQGWQLDKVARDHIDSAGYGGYFNHRLGHSLGHEVHSNAVNLDGWETHDTRPIIPGIAITIEPGIYLPDFGVRSEIDVFVSEDGPVVTTQMQRDVVRIASGT
ncbi:M24 family metallopeptidase [Dehalococcoidia bacterium]|nr:M24 family metallopeptidase [Dehalococcoidia bacterium]